MDDLSGPFDSQPRSDLAEQIDDMFARLRVPTGDMPILESFLQATLTLPPQVAQVKTLLRTWQKVTDKVLNRTSLHIQLARGQCTPYYRTPSDISETFYCACALSAMERDGIPGLVTIARETSVGYAALQAGAAYDDSERLHAEKLPRKQSHAELPPISKLLVETRAVVLMSEALRLAQSKEVGPQAAPAFAAVARYRPLMGQIDSAMADYFRYLDRFLVPNTQPAGSENGKVVALRPRVSR